MKNHMETPSRILVVDDEPENIEIIADIFADRHEILVANSGERALDIVGAVNPDLILLDVVMPGIDGYEVCRRLKSDPETADIPILFITALGDAEQETMGLELGAADYVAKPFCPAVIRARVGNQLEVRHARAQLRRLALSDGLTGLASRRRFDEVLAEEHARHTRSGRALSVVLLDIDHFRTFNDHYGHLCGDECLKQVAHLLERTVVRAVDLVARYGGEEFACILPDTNHAGAVVLAEKIRLGVKALAIPHLGSSSSATQCVTVSLGVFTSACTPLQTAREIMEQTDLQLAAAKGAGRNRVCGHIDASLKV